MQKIIQIWFVFIVLMTNCSTGKQSISNISSESSMVASDAIRKTFNNNLTNNDFFINKGKISTSGEAGHIGLLFTMKYKAPETYLISLRSKTGMEAYRIFINNDTVLINDRLNKNLLTGNTTDFERITGIPTELLKISIGDFFVSDSKSDANSNCINNELKISDYYLGMLIKIIIDCRIGKTKSVLLTTGLTDQYINIEYKKHRNNIYQLPRRIEINDFLRKIKIKISVNKYSTPWYGEIEFIPGSGYQIKPLI